MMHFCYITKQVVMNAQTLTILLMVISTLLTIIGFLLAFYFNRAVKSMDSLNKAVTEFRIMINDLKGELKASKDMSEINKESCKDRHVKIDEKLKEHDERLQEHTQELTKLKTVMEQV